MRKFEKNMLAFAAFGTLAFGNLLTASANDQPTAAVTAQEINRASPTYLGKNVELSGHVDRIVAPGAFIISDSQADAQKTPSHRILVLTANPTQGPLRFDQQQSGTTGVNLREGDQLKLSGKVEKIVISSESETLSTQGKPEAMASMSSTMPVVVVAPGSVHKMG
jgi:hypothetical protein